VQSPPDNAEIARAQTLMLDRYGIERLVSDMDNLYRALLAKKGRS